MKLIDLLVQELPKRGGWPNFATQVRQDKDGEVCFEPETRNDFYPGIMSSDSKEWAEKNNKGTSDLYVTKMEYEAALEASQQPAWSGEGLPPVGCECEVWCEDHADYEWVKIKVFGEYKGIIIGIVNMPGEIIHDDINKYAPGYLRAKFRPIRTKAERRRDAAIKAMIYAAETDTAKPFVDAIYDAIAAGKIPGVKLEDV